jgi:hypothetical protein
VGDLKPTAFIYDVKWRTRNGVRFTYDVANAARSLFARLQHHIFIRGGVLFLTRKPLQPRKLIGNACHYAPTIGRLALSLANASDSQSSSFMTPILPRDSTAVPSFRQPSSLLRPSHRRPLRVSRRRSFFHEPRAFHRPVACGDRNRMPLLSPSVGIGSWWSSRASMGSGDPDLRSISTNQRDLVRHGLVSRAFLLDVVYLSYFCKKYVRFL